MSKKWKLKPYAVNPAQASIVDGMGYEIALPDDVEKARGLVMAHNESFREIDKQERTILFAGLHMESDIYDIVYDAIESCSDYELKSYGENKDGRYIVVEAYDSGE